MGDALGAIGRSFAPVLGELGRKLVTLDLNDPNGPRTLSEIAAAGPIEFAFSFVGMGAELEAVAEDGDRKNLWEAWRIPYISLYGDTPAYFFDRHVMPARLCGALYAFPEHADLRKRLPLVPGVVGVSPPGALDAIQESAIDFRRKESGRLLFLKNGNDPEQLIAEWRRCLPTETFQMLLDVAGALVERMARDSTCDIDATVKDYFAQRNLDVTHAYPLRLFFIAQIDDYLRRVKSNMITRVLMDFPVDMFGYNWEHLDFRGKRINFTPGGDYTRSLPMIREALGLIDMSPNTARAPHERPLRAFGAHTLCLTNEQSFFRDNLAVAPDFMFSFAEDSIRTKIADVIAHPKRYVEIGREAAREFRAKFSLLRFAETLVSAAAALRLEQGDRPGALQSYFGWPPQTLGAEATYAGRER
jgi:hypothetical protein